MNKQEYTEYQATVAAFFESEGINCLTQDNSEEPYFSGQDCDCCGGLPGDRYDCNGYNPATKEVQGGYSICPDCLYYHEYGQLDDMTMLDTEGDT